MEDSLNKYFGMKVHYLIGERKWKQVLVRGKYDGTIIVSSNEETAKSTHLVQRSTSQIDGYEFAQAMMIPNAFLKVYLLFIKSKF